MAPAIRRALGRERGRPARLPARRRRDRAHRRAARPRCPPTSTCTACTAASIPPRSAPPSPPRRPARRKLVLATSIAETSLTLDGVRIVVDSGLARRPRYDRAAGLTRLVTERASQAAVDPARRPRRPPGAGPRLPALGGGGDAEPAALRPARNPRGRPVRLAARLRDLGRRRSARAALARSAARRRRSTRRAARCRPRRARRGRPPDRRMAAPSPLCRCRRASPIC